MPLTELTLILWSHGRGCVWTNGPRNPKRSLRLALKNHVVENTVPGKVCFGDHQQPLTVVNIEVGAVGAPPAYIPKGAQQQVGGMALRVQPVKKALDTIAEASRGEEKNDLDAVAFKGAHLIVVAACLDNPGSFDQIVPMVLGHFFP